MLKWFKKKTDTSYLIINTGLIFLLVLIIGIINYKPNTILTGWDNLHPEFNFLLNIKRSFFAVWQEYQSLGLLGGMGHAADIIRQLFLFFLSIFIPQQLLRYFWTILTLFIGGVGIIFLSTSIVSHSSFGQKLNNIRFIPLLASLFYVLNLATLQTYYVPFETFTSHFAFLPWMILASLNFFNKQSRKNAIILALTFFLTTSQSYVPTLFVVFFIASTIILLSSAYKLVMLRRKIDIVKIAIKYYTILTISNAFWLLPFLYFTFTNASTNVNSKINQIATPRIILQNKEFGTLQDVALLKGFWFNSIEPNFDKIPTYLLEAWRAHLANPLVTFFGFVIFGVVIFGVIDALRRREPLLVSFGVLFIFVFTILANATPPFSWIDSLFTHIPLFSQAFRFTFTKFSILAGLLYALFFGIGIGRILELITLLAHKFLKKTYGLITTSILTVAILSIIFFSLPIFQGKLFYEKEQLKMPSDYKKVFSFFDKKKVDARIATLPIHSFWSWNYYEWGYTGSGFLWYGIKQPIIDRAFDSWGATSENSYNELFYALYSKNARQFENVLNKYQISYLIVDRNIYSVNSQKSLFYKETADILATIKATKEKTFGKIDIYKVPLKKNTNNFVYSNPVPQSVNSYAWGDNDIAYSTFGNYITSNNPNVFYPFRSLLINKKMKKDFSVIQNEKEILLITNLPKITESQLILPSYTNEKLLPVEVEVEPDTTSNMSLISVKPLFPIVKIGNKTITDNLAYSFPLFVAPFKEQDYLLFINGEKMIPLNVRKAQKIRTYLKLTWDNTLSLSHPEIDQLYVQTIQKDTLLSLPQMQQKTLNLKNITKGQELTIILPKAIDSFYSYKFYGKDFNNASDCNKFRNGSIKTKIAADSIVYEAKNDSICSSVYAKSLLHNEGYIITVNANNEKGSPLYFWVLNDLEGIAPLELNLFNNGISNFFLPPMEENAIAYSFHFDTISIGKDESRNILKSVEINRIPYNYLVHIMLTKPHITSLSISDFTATHPNESLYQVTPSKIGQGKTLLVLSQSYDMAWQAYNGKKTWWSAFFPFFGKALEHVKVNNWANGWIVDSSTLSKDSQINIVYLPQYLEYFGFIAFFVMIGILLFKQFPITFRKRLYIINAFFEKHAQIFKKRIILRYKIGKNNPTLS